MDTASDTDGNLYIAEWRADIVRRVDAATGTITTYAGNRTRGFSGDGGPAAEASLNTPLGLSVDRQGNLFIADAGNNRIRRVDARTRIITTLVGSGAPGVADGPALSAELDFPADVAIDSDGNLYIAHWDRVRRMDARTALVTTIAGAGNDTIAGAGCVAVGPDDSVYFGDGEHAVVRRIEPTLDTISVVAGNGSFEFSGDGGPATSAGIGYAACVAVDDAGNVAILGASDNSRVHLLTSPARVEIDGDTVDTTATARHITLYIDAMMPARRLKPATLKLYRIDPRTSDPIGATLRPAQPRVKLIDHDHDGHLELAVQFKASDLISLGSPGDDVRLRLFAQARDGRFVSGDTTAHYR